VTALPNCQENLAMGHHFSISLLDNQPCWIEWSEYLGAWISTDGADIKVCILEDARGLDSGELTLGFTSVLTGVCLNLQGQVAIHANAVALKGKAIGFIGYSGAGKSTLSAFCAGCGAGFVTDDVLVVDEQGYVLPGNPRIKLYPETGVSLGLEASQETNYKIFYHPEYNLGTTLHHAPVPLGKLYLLAEAETDQVYTEPIPSAQAVFELLTHGYDVSYFIARNPKLFDAYVHLVDQVPLRRLVYPHDFSRLPEVYALLLEES
jgi:energy-coupling factor transporter ATP-binding protein EcfA2